MQLLESASRKRGRSAALRRKSWRNRSVVYLSKIENGRVYPTLETLSNICTELDVELAEVLSNTEMERKDYANDRVLELFNACSVRVKPIALSLLEELAKL